MRFHFEEEVRVDFHLNGGYTKLLIIRFINNEHFNNPYIDIPTKDIPNHLRKMGTHFILKINEDDSIKIKE
jgi:hypothetical protein